MKVPVGGGTPVVVRTDNARAPALASDGSALYYIVPLQNSNGSQDYELRVARPGQITDCGEKRTFIARRISWSSDGKWVFAAVGEGDADIVQMDGLLGVRIFPLQ